MCVYSDSQKKQSYYQFGTQSFYDDLYTERKILIEQNWLMITDELKTQM